MSELSPAAQAVLDALYMDELNGPQQLMARAHAAAALRAVADQAQASLYYTTPATDWSKGWKQGVSDAAQGFLAIADELEGTQ